MPLLNKISAITYQIGIWQITEPVENLFSSVNLSETEAQYYSSIKNEARKKEWLTVRLVLKTLLNKEAEIIYNENGKPYLKDNDYSLSVSHSKELVAVIIGESKALGIDVEKISAKPKRVCHKFLSGNELENYKESKDEVYTFLWSAKESIFKLYSNYHLIFDTQIIFPFVDFTDEGNFTAKVSLNNTEINQEVFYKKINNFVLTWVESDIL